jgi:hypothetical protein
MILRFWIHLSCAVLVVATPISSFPLLAKTRTNKLSLPAKTRALKMLTAAGAHVEWVTQVSFVSDYPSKLPFAERYHILEFNDTWAGDSVSPILRLKKIRTVIVRSDARLSLDDFRAMSKVRGLEELIIELPIANDDVLSAISQSRMTKLRWIYVEGVNVTDAGLLELMHLQSLEEVAVRGTSVTDAGLERLAELPRLKTLNLRDTLVTDQGLRHLPRTLERLYLARTAITDKGLAIIAELPQLDILDMRGTSISDTGLAHLHHHPQLRVLLVNETNVTVTQKGLDALAKTLDLDRE